MRSFFGVCNWILIVLTVNATMHKKAMANDNVITFGELIELKSFIRAHIRPFFISKLRP